MKKEKYTIEEVKEAGVLFYCLYEHATEQVLDYSVEKDAIQEMYSFLMNGGGFDGFTPSFMLIPIPSKNLNEEFDKYNWN